MVSRPSTPQSSVEKAVALAPTLVSVASCWASWVPRSRWGEKEDRSAGLGEADAEAGILAFSFCPFPALCPLPCQGRPLNPEGLSLTAPAPPWPTGCSFSPSHRAPPKGHWLHCGESMAPGPPTYWKWGQPVPFPFPPQTIQTCAGATTPPFSPPVLPTFQRGGKQRLRETKK